MEGLAFKIEDESCADFVMGFTNKKRFVKAFREKYEFIIAYHATNIDGREINSIETEGLKLSTAGLLKRKALKRFITESDSKELKNEIKSEIKNFFTDKDLITRGEINFSLTRQSIITESYHYLLMGPESLLPLADKLSKHRQISFRDRMIKHGYHCIVTASIPVKKTKGMWIEGIYEYLINGWVETSLVYRRKLPATNIISVEKIDRPFDFHGIGY